MIVNKFKKNPIKKIDFGEIQDDKDINIHEQSNIVEDIIIFKKPDPIEVEKIDVLDIPEDNNIELDNTVRPIEVDKVAKEKFMLELDNLFNMTQNMLNTINNKKQDQKLNTLDNLKKNIVNNAIIDNNNKISIKITKDIIDDATPILNQIPPEFLNNIKHTENTVEPHEKIEITDQYFLKEDKININGNKKVLILRNKFKNFEKLYTNFFEFIEDNLTIFIDNILLDKPICDKYKYIVYDNNLVNQQSIYDIYKSWNNTPYSKICQDKILEHKEKLNNIRDLLPNYITIIICVRNNFNFLLDSLGSLINQTSNRWNCVIINDGSNSDIELDVIFADNYKTIFPYLNKIKIINNKSWNGVVYCQTQALDYVNTEIVGILDCDDKLDPICVEMVLEMYEKFNGFKDIFVITDFKITDDKFNFIQNGFTKIPNKSILQDGFGLAFRSFKLRDYYKTSGYNPKFRYGGEDVDLIYKLETVATPIFLNRQLYYYRRFDQTSKIKKHLSTSIYHKYNCLMAKIVNGIERYGNIFKIRIYSRNSKDTRQRNIFNAYSRVKKPLKFRNQDFYVELYLGNSCELHLGLLKCGNTNDLLARHFIFNYLNTGIYEHQVYIKYSFEYRCLVINDRPIEFSIDEHLSLNVNNLYDEIYISVDDNILNIDLDNLRENEMKEYRNYILEKYNNSSNSSFNNLGINFKTFSNIKNII
jgi:hypothetical protein